MKEKDLMRCDAVRLQFISHFTDQYNYLDSIRMALEGGCRWVQLRMKGVPESEMEPVALQVREMCREAGAVFIIDDHVELVRKVGADGVHVGKNDMPVDEARRILGADFIIGGTANTLEDVRMHWQRGADYVGCGPFRFTSTKQNLSPLLGLEGYRRLVAGMRAEGISIPLVAIGGITLSDVPAIMATGATGIAISGAVLNAADPTAAMRAWVETMESSFENHHYQS